MKVWEQITPVRGTARGRRERRQRERGQGGAGPARPVPRRCPPAEPPAATRAVRARDQRHPDRLGPGMTKKPEELRSYRWFGGERTSGLRSFSHRSRMRQLGVTARGAPGQAGHRHPEHLVRLNPCHMHLRQRAEQVKRGVLEAGGFPVELPVATLSETFQKPTPMLYRNLLAMETEELLRSYPADGAVLMGGCDKTTPALLMGAASAEHPGHLRDRRPDAARQLPRPAARQRHRHVEVLGRRAGRADRRLRAGRTRVRHRPLPGPLHDDGHRVHA